MTKPVLKKRNYKEIKEGSGSLMLHGISFSVVNMWSDWSTTVYDNKRFKLPILPHTGAKLDVLPSYMSSMAAIDMVM